MKKLLSIVISAITLGVFADAGNTPMTFELPEGLAAGTEVTLVCNGEVVHTTTATSDSITYSTEGLAAGEYWLELAGEPITESLMIGASASAPQFASAKYALPAGTEYAISNIAHYNNRADWAPSAFMIPASEDLKAGTKVSVATIVLGIDRSNGAHPNTITINNVTSAAVAWDNQNAIATDGTNNAYAATYTFTGLEVVVGKSYEVTLDGGCRCALASKSDTTTALSVFTTSSSTAYYPLASVAGSVTSLPSREAIGFAFNASTQTWTPSEPTEFMPGDTLAYTGTGNATLATDVTVPLTVGAGVNLTTSGTIAISGKSKFEAGSILTVASGTTTISNTDNGTNGNRGLMGTINIASGATLALTQGDAINYSGATELNIHGTLDCGNKRQSFKANNKINLYVGGSITGNGDGNAAIDLTDENNGDVIHIIDDADVESKTATISAVMRGNAAGRIFKIDVADSVTATISGVIKQGVPTKIGAGMLVLSGANTFTTLDVQAGTVKNGGQTGLGAYNNGTDCDVLSLIKVADGATLDVTGIAGSNYGSCYRVELAGTVTNSGAAMGTTSRQLSKITVTGDNAKITGANSYALLCSSYAATKIDLGGHMLEVAMDAGKEFYLRTTTVYGTGTIKVTGGKLTFLSEGTGSDLDAESEVSFVLDNGQVFKANSGAWLDKFSSASDTKTVVFNPNNYVEQDKPTTPAYVPANKVDAYNTWKTAHAEALATATYAVAAEAFALNCEPTTDAIDAAKAAFKVTITIDAEGVHVEVPAGYYNIDPVVKGSATVDGEYTLDVDNASAKFFKAFIIIPSQN